MRIDWCVDFLYVMELAKRMNVRRDVLPSLIHPHDIWKFGSTRFVEVSVQDVNHRCRAMVWYDLSMHLFKDRLPLAICLVHQHVEYEMRASDAQIK
jgi:hypothetical protein